MEFVDTHCHIHFPSYGLAEAVVIDNAKAAGVRRLLAVGCTLTDSQLGVAIAARHDNIWASIGLHPHEAVRYVNDHKKLRNFRNLLEGKGHEKIVAIGECGLDYHYMHAPKRDQQKLFRYQLDLAVEHNLPLIFHVREAFDDFWHILDEYKGIRGVVHSFSSDEQDLKNILERGLYVGVNGIMTFTKDEKQLAAAKQIPLQKLLLETDAPFLTPTPYRGTICEPKHVVVTATFLSQLRGESLAEIARVTTQNARGLFGIN